MINSISDIGTELGVGEPGSVFQYKDLGSFMSNIIPLVMSLAALISFGIILWGGFMWITAGGDQESLKTAKARIINALMGLGLVVTAYLIWRLALRFLGLSAAFPKGG